MKRILKGLILAFVGVFGLTLASCGEETKLPTEQTPQTPVHEHTTGEGWKRDSATHWQECSGCDELVNVAVHDYNEFTLATDKCVKTRDCKVCGYTETRDVDHTWKDGVCTVCGEELLITQYYVRGSFGGSDWPALDEYKLAIDYGTASATITVTLTAGDKFKVADSKWSAEFNAKTIKAAEGLFDGDNDIIVKTTAEYKIVLTKLDTTAPECEITQLCVHTFGEWTLVPGKTCEKTATCTKCNAVSTKVEHAGYGEWTLVEGKTCDWESVCACGDKKTEVRHTWGDDIVCDKCQAVNVLQFYVRGDMNGWDTSTALVLGADKKSASVLLVVEAGQCFKIATEDWKNEFDFNTITFNVNGFEAKAADATDVKATKDGVYMVNVSGLDTLEPTCTIDPIQLYVRGDMNGWGTDAKYAFVYDKATDTSTFTLELADVTQGFKIASPEWDVYNKHYNIGALGDGKYGYGTAEADAVNIKFTETGFYVITITGVTTGDPVVKIEKGTGEVKPVVTPVPDLYVVGSHNGWGDAFVDANKLSVNAEADTATIEVFLVAGTEFKVSDSKWACKYGFGATGLTYAEGLFTDAGGNLKVAKSGLYKVVVAGLADKAKATCTITLEKGESTIEQALALEDGSSVIITATVNKITSAWDEKYKNMSVTLSDGSHEILVFRLTNEVVVGDKVVVYGKISTENEVKQIAQGSLSVIVEANDAVVPTYDLTKVTNANQLVDGAQIVVAANNILMGYPTDKYFTVVTCEELGQSVQSSRLLVLTLKAVPETSYWLLQAGDLYVTYVEKTTVLLSNKTEAASQWTIELNQDGTASIKNVQAPTRLLFHSTSNVRFAAYASTNVGTEGYNQVTLYTAKKQPIIVETLVSPQKGLKWTEETAVEGSDIFSYTSEVKTESIKIDGATVPGLEINSQFSLTKGKVQLYTPEEGEAETTPYIKNGIKLVLSEDVKITVYAAVKEDKLSDNITVTLLDATGAKVAGSSTTLTADSVTACEIELSAGTYYLGGTSGGLYVYAIVVSK